MGNMFKAYLYGRSRSGDREEARLRLFNPDGTPVEIGAGGVAGPKGDKGDQGDPGPPGPAAEGAVTWQGVWVPANSYDEGSMVKFGSHLYAAKTDVGPASVPALPAPQFNSNRGWTLTPQAWLSPGVPVSHTIVAGDPAFPENSGPRYWAWAFRMSAGGTVHIVADTGPNGIMLATGPSLSTGNFSLPQDLSVSGAGDYVLACYVNSGGTPNAITGLTITSPSLVAPVTGPDADSTHWDQMV